MHVRHEMYGILRQIAKFRGERGRACRVFMTPPSTPPVSAPCARARCALPAGLATPSCILMINTSSSLTGDRACIVPVPVGPSVRCFYPSGARVAVLEVRGNRCTELVRPRCTDADRTTFHFFSACRSPSWDFRVQVSEVCADG